MPDHLVEILARFTRALRESAASERDPRTAFRSLADSPDWDECASSTMTANRFPFRSVVAFAITGNF